ncbi:NadR/Ttd14 AAA domain-containing protein [Cupriavidus sp. H19C3]|uniref:AAA family ATPase n=1 Tax=Cupriavidus sp. H19C3 TaxID=3241603 RepID=UPI003BF781D1
MHVPVARQPPRDPRDPRDHGDPVEDAAVARFFVLTGGPGSGKSTLLGALARIGFFCPDEAGRGVIQDQVAIGGPALPWRDPLRFAELMLSWDMRSYRMAHAHAGPVLFDRGIPDVVGYLRTAGVPVPAHIARAARTFRYHRTVFIAPPWPEIFTRDEERRQSADEAARTHAAMVATYAGLGYTLVELPRASVEARVQFMLARLPAHP